MQVPHIRNSRFSDPSKFQVMVQSGKPINHAEPNFRSDFDIEGTFGDHCMFDYIEMRDGDNENSTLIGRFCGDQSLAPELITSTFNYLWMTFVTDGSVQNRGFVLNYTTVEVCSGIGGILRDTAGIIRSPAHPQEYPHGVTCRWVNGKVNISVS